MPSNEEYLDLAIQLARKNVDEHHGRPFGAVLVDKGQIVSTGVNEIHATHDPSTHAEMQAIRAATSARRSPRLDGCVMYASGNPCPMCLALMHMIGIGEVYFAYSNADAEPFNLSTAKIYAEMAKPLAQQSIKIVYLPVQPDMELYKVWQRSTKG